jgi:hypothetical protein
MDTKKKRGRPSNGFSVKLQLRITPAMHEDLLRIDPNPRRALAILLDTYFVSKSKPDPSTDPILRRAPPGWWKEPSR